MISIKFCINKSYLMYIIINKFRRFMMQKGLKFSVN